MDGVQINDAAAAAAAGGAQQASSSLISLDNTPNFFANLADAMQLNDAVEAIAQLADQYPAQMAAFVYLALLPPSPIFGIVDYFLLRPIDDLIISTTLTPNNFRVGPKLGEGNFGRTFEGLRTGGLGRAPEYEPRYGAQTDQEKRNRVVLKRIGTGTFASTDDARSDFLSRGTVARGAVEVGLTESYMNGVLRRSLCPGIAQYIGRFNVTRNNNDNLDFSMGSEWLVFGFESDATLGDLINIGDYPETAAQYLAKGARDEVAQRTKITKNVARQLLGVCSALHARGIVHRDIKPENVLVTNTGAFRLIDMGAATDLRNGVNYSPDAGMLDPLYGPPESFVMPDTTSRAPNPLVAALGSPLVWVLNAPDLFDSYSVGITLLRVAVPALSSEAQLKKLNQELSRFDYDLRTWRRETEGMGGGLATRCDFSALDGGGGLGWDLCCRLVCPRNSLQRGRLGCRMARLHPFVWLP